MNPKEKKHPSLSVLKHNSVFDDYTILGPNDIIPLVKQFSPWLYQQWDKLPHWVIKADLGRLLYIYYNGGIYLDCDCVIRQPFTLSPLVLFIESMPECKDNSLRIANYAFGAEKESPFLKNVLEECIRRLQQLPSTITQQNIVWVCGQDVITTIYHATKPEATLLDQSYLHHLEIGSWR
jgi:mannosyltransferase OCH1-like enzyme